MKSLSNRGIHRCNRRSTSIRRVSPACDEFFNAARKFVTEFIDIGRHVGIIRSGVGGGWLHALQLLQGFGETRERPRGPRGAARAAHVCGQRVDRGKFVEDGAVQSRDGVGKRRNAPFPFGLWQHRRAVLWAPGCSCSG